jgi:hypothetical protein
VNPPPGANFYPIFSTRNDDTVGCFWQLGGANIPGTKNTFGGTSTAEYGSLLFLDYPGLGFTPIHRTNDFRQVLNKNPCQPEDNLEQQGCEGVGATAPALVHVHLADTT